MGSKQNDSAGIVDGDGNDRLYFHLNDDYGRGMVRYILRTVLLLMICFTAGQSFAQAGPDVSDAALLSEDKNVDGVKRVLIGGYLNNVNTVDLRTHSYPGDIYIWFRWLGDEIDPVEGFEFMNLFDPEAHVESTGYDEHQFIEADGSNYNFIRHQGAFATDMSLDKYPFDKQVLRFIIEDAEYGDEVLQYIPDPEGFKIGVSAKLPGYKIGEPRLIIKSEPYPTIFGDLNNPETGAYSRAIFEVPITRPWGFGIFKLILPVMIVLVCSSLALFIDPTHTEGRIGLVITALLTLVAMQITTAGTLPEVGYLMLLDVIYLLSYAFILVIMGRVAYGSWVDAEDQIAVAVKGDRRILAIATVSYILAIAVITTVWLSR